MEYSEHELSILLTSDEEIQALNSQYRNRDKPTDVLSFSQLEGEELPLEEKLLGDVVISVETASRQAEAAGYGLMVEIFKLTIHGVLHLVGYDHENVTAEEAEKMLNLERSFFEKVGDLLEL